MKNCLVIESKGSTYFSFNVTVEDPFVNLEKPLSKSSYLVHVSEEKTHIEDYYLEYGSPAPCEILKIPASKCKIYILGDKELPKWVNLRYEDVKKIEKEKKAEFLKENPASAPNKHKKKF
jgi:hypothetical protein